MTLQVNSHQLVLRRDSATGWAKVDWASHMPLGRFTHIDVILETDTISPISSASPFFTSYKHACEKAYSLNAPLLQYQIQTNRSRNWLLVPLDLNDKTANIDPDEFGNYQTVATQAYYRLCHNHPEVWAVVHEDSVLQIQSQKPAKPLETLEYQVWKHHRLEQLSHYAGMMMQGRLLVQESGLWFVPDPD